MPFGLIFSLVCHVALLVWAYGPSNAARELEAPETPSISAELITPSEFLRLKQGSEDAKHLETKAKDKPTTDDSKNETKKADNTPPPPPPPAPVEVAKVEPPPPPEAAKPEPVKPEPVKPEPPKPDPIAEAIKQPPPPPSPEAGPTPDEQKLLEQKIDEAAKKAAEEAQKKAEDYQKKAEEAAKKKVAAEALKKKLAEDAKKRKLAEEARKKAEAAKNKFDPNALANLIEKAPGDSQPKALIDKDPNKKGQQAAGTSQAATQSGKEAGTANGHDTVLSAREQDLLAGMLQSQLHRCAKMPGGGGGIDTPVVTVQWRVRQDGTVDGEPVVQNPQNTPLFKIAAEASVNAVKNCSPLSLPADKYASWSTITWDFDWPKMLGLR